MDAITTLSETSRHVTTTEATATLYNYTCHCPWPHLKLYLTCSDSYQQETQKEWVSPLDM